MSGLALANADAQCPMTREPARGSLRLLPAGTVLWFPGEHSELTPASQTYADTFEWGPCTAAAVMKGEGRLAPGKIQGSDTARLAGRSQGMAGKCLRRHS